MFVSRQSTFKIRGSLVAVVVAMYALFLPSIALAQDASGTGHVEARTKQQTQQLTEDGSALGDQLLQRAPTLDFNEGGEHDMGVVTLDGRKIDVNQLIPSSGDKAYVERLKAAGGKRDLLSAKTLFEEESKRMEKDAGVTGQVYRTMQYSTAHNRISLEAMLNDPIMKSSVNVLQDTAKTGADIGDVFADCQTEHSTNVSNGSAYVTDYKTCEKVVLPNDSSSGLACSRSYAPPSEGTPHFILASLKVSHVSYKKGRTASTVVRLYPEGEQIPEAISDFHWEDISLSSGVAIMLLDPPTFGNRWEATFSTFFPPEYEHFTYSPQVKITWNASAINSSDPFLEEGDCTMRTDNFCRAEWTCDERAEDSVSGLPELFPGAGKTCKKASLHYDCSGIYTGQVCWTNAAGEEKCSGATVGDAPPNTCGALERDPQCSVAKQACADGAVSDSGYCYVMAYSFACRRPVEVDDVVTTTVNKCPTATPCLDGSCNSSKQDPGVSVSSRNEVIAKKVITNHILTDWTMTAPPPGAAADGTEGQ